MDWVSTDECLKTGVRHLSVGPTLPDGGAPLGDVSQMIGPARYFELLSKIFR